MTRRAAVHLRNLGGGGGGGGGEVLSANLFFFLSIFGKSRGCYNP